MQLSFVITPSSTSNIQDISTYELNLQIKRISDMYELLQAYELNLQIKRISYMYELLQAYDTTLD